jgi:hypothetical protein
MQMANCLITIMRGSEVNDYGDISDIGRPIYSHVPAAAVEKSQVVFDPATQRPQAIRTVMCVVDSWADVLTTDTIQREDSGDFFSVLDIQRQPSLIGVAPDIILTLRERSGVSVSSD